MGRGLEARYQLGIRVGKQCGGKSEIRLYLEQHEEKLKDSEAREVCAKSIADLMSDSEGRLSEAHRRMYAHVYLVWESDWESVAFLAGLLKGWAEKQGVKLSLAA